VVRQIAALSWARRMQDTSLATSLSARQASAQVVQADAQSRQASTHSDTLPAPPPFGWGWDPSICST
jgi:hypothetical protein